MTLAQQNEVREFTGDDWCSFEGAEAWDDSQPLIYEHSELNAHTLVVADRNRIEVIQGYEHHVGCTHNRYYREIRLAPALARLWMPALAQVTHSDLLASGFGYVRDE